MKTKHLLLVILLDSYEHRLQAQGHIPPPDLLWTWQGDSGMFHGSFETPSNYLTPNIGIANGLYNLSFTAPDHDWSSDLNISGDSTSYIYYGPGAFGIDVYDPSGEVLVGGPGAMSAELGNTTLFGETGSWEITPIPEPSSLAMLALGGGAAMWLVSRRRADLLAMRCN